MCKNFPDRFQCLPRHENSQGAWCTLGRTVVDELSQEERCERALVADSVKNAASIGFDLHRRLAFEDTSPLSVEVIVSAIEEFKGVVEEAVSAGEVTAHDLRTMLQDALEANSEGTEHWSVASPPPATVRSPGFELSLTKGRV